MLTILSITYLHGFSFSISANFNAEPGFQMGYDYVDLNYIKNVIHGRCDTLVGFVSNFLDLVIWIFILYFFINIFLSVFFYLYQRFAFGALLQQQFYTYVNVFLFDVQKS